VTPEQYRAVAVTDVDVPLTEEALWAHLRDRQAYRRTRYVVARRGGQVAVAELDTRADGDLFVDIVGLRLLAGPDETVLVDRPEVDTAVPSQLAAVATELPGVRCVVVRGRYQHVSFIVDARPRRVHVLDVAPPWPAKLVDQVERLLDTAESLPPTLCLPQVIDLDDLARAHPADHYLLPCRGSGVSVPGATVSYLDEVPEPAEWTLIGCERSRQIHAHFYPDLAARVPQVDFCPAARAAAQPLPAGEARLTKCCLLETHVETRGDTVVVPWGASLEQVAEGLATAGELAEQRSDAPTPEPTA